MSFREMILSLLTGTIALGPLVFSAFNWVPQLKQIPFNQKRIWVAVASVTCAGLLYLIASFLGYIAVPDTRDAAVEQVWQYVLQAGLSGFTSATLLHGFQSKTQDPAKSTSENPGKDLVDSGVQPIDTYLTPFGKPRLSRPLLRDLIDMRECNDCPARGCLSCPKGPVE